MERKTGSSTAWMGMALAALAWALPAAGRSHCDTLGGPVVRTAAQALEKGDLTPVLKWVKKADETEIKAAFKKALAVRGGGKAAQELADRWFFETVVRVHRAGEGAPYTGLVEAPAEPIIQEADHALESGDAKALAKALGDHAAKEVLARFDALLAAKKHENESVEAGRKSVAAYVSFTHFVEALHKSIVGGGGHGDEHHE